MAIDWAKARQRMTDDTAYRGTGISRPRGPSRDRQRLGSRRFSAPQRGGSFSDFATGKGYGSPRATDFKTSGALRRGIGNITNKFVPPIARMMKGVGDLASGAMRGSRLHQAYQDDLGRVAGHKEWEKDKRAMMTGAGLKKGDPGYEDSDQAFYDKYMNLAEMAQDNQKAQEYRDIAETAWRNKQTSDRLAAIQGFEDYAPGKYTGVGEGATYTGNVAGGRDRIGKEVPGVQIMRDLLAKYGGSEYAGPGQTIGAAGGPIPDPDMDITSDLYGMYPGPEDDLLYGEPGTGTGTERVARGISYPEPDMFDTLYGEPTPDPFGGMYESPLTDRLYGEPTNIGLASEKALDKRGFAIPGGEGYTGPLPNISIELGPYDEDLSNIDRYSDRAKRLGLSDTLQTYNTYTHGMGTRQKPATAEGLENIKQLGIAADNYDREEELQNLIADHYNSATGLYEESPVSKGRWGSTYNQYR